MKELFTKLIRNYRHKASAFFVRKPPAYPCKECFLVLSGAGCIEVCDKIELDKEKLRNHAMLYKNCPDCGHDKYYRGPSGGLSVNIQCGLCKHKFNNTLPMQFERIGI